MRWMAEEDAAACAARKLPRMAEKYFAAGRKAVSGKLTPRNLHRFRVRTKQFRYTLELFHPLYAHQLSTELASLQKLQKLLGHISDQYTILDLMPPDYPLAKELDRGGQKDIQKFVEYWKTSFDAPVQLRLWRDSLSKTLAGVPQVQAPVDTIHAA